MTTHEAVTVRYSRRPSQGIVMGITLTGLISLAVAAGFFFILLFTGGILKALLGLLLAVPIVIGGLRKKNGVPYTTVLIREVKFIVRKRSGATSYRRKPTLIEHGALELHGYEGNLHVWESSDGAAVIWDSHKGTASITCLVATKGLAAGGISALSAEERDDATANWMVVCGTWARRRQISKVTLMERTRPGTIVRERLDFEKQTVPAGLEEVAASYVQSLAMAEQQAVLRPTTITLTLDTEGKEGKQIVKAHGGGKAGVMAMAEQEIATTTESLYAAGFTRVAWWTPREWAAWGRAIVDPAREAALDTRIGTEFEGVTPAIATPMAIEEEKLHVETDSAFHRAYWIMEWPRINTFPGFMGTVAFARNHAGYPVRHTIALVGTPTPLSHALALIKKERDRWRANSTIRKNRGSGDNAADRADWHNLESREEELISGQSEYSFTGYLVVSGLTMEALESHCASMENAATTAGIELLPLSCEQWAALQSVAYPCGLGM